MVNEELPGGGAGYYVRRSTGLVRAIGPWTNIALIIAFSSPAVAALVITNVPSTWPGVSLLWPAVGAAVIAIPPILLYAWLTSAMPRAGGDYVFNSRILHPSVGFAANFMLGLSQLIVSGAFVALISPFALSPALATIGVSTKNQGLLRASTTLLGLGWTFWIGVAVVLSAGVLVCFGQRMWMRLVWICTLFVMVGAVLAVLITAIKSRSDFQSAISSFGVSYQGVIHTATNAGFDPNAAATPKTIFLAIAAGFITFAFIPITTYAGGEIRSPKQTLQRAMLWSLAILGIVVFLMFALAERTFGRQFLGAASYLDLYAPAKYPFPAPSFYYFYVSVLTHNVALDVILGASYVLAFTVWIPVAFLAVSRQLFAWAFDRILPDRLTNVSNATHAPVVANVVVVIGLLIGTWLSVYRSTSIAGLVFAGETGAAIAFAVTGISGIILYWRRPELFETLPPVARQRVGGLPLITTIGALAVLVYLAYAWSLIVTSGETVGTIAGLIGFFLVVPFIVYAVSVRVNKRRGIDLAIVFAELPPE